MSRKCSLWIILYLEKIPPFWGPHPRALSMTRGLNYGPWTGLREMSPRHFQPICFTISRILTWGSLWSRIMTSLILLFSRWIISFTSCIELLLSYLATCLHFTCLRVLSNFTLYTYISLFLWLCDNCILFNFIVSILHDKWNEVFVNNLGLKLNRLK